MTLNKSQPVCAKQPISISAKITSLGFLAALFLKPWLSIRDLGRTTSGQVKVGDGDTFQSLLGQSERSEKVERNDRSVALSTALSQRPTDVNNVFKLAAGAADPKQIMWTEIAPDENYSPCSDRNRQEGDLASKLAPMWEIENQSWPVLREGRGSVCRIQGQATAIPTTATTTTSGGSTTTAATATIPAARPTTAGNNGHSMPFLTLVEGYQKEACEYNVSDLPDLPDQGPYQWHGCNYFLIWPPDGHCTPNNPCALDLHLHGIMERTNTPTNILICKVMAVRNEDNLASFAACVPACRKRFRTVFVVPVNNENQTFGDAEGGEQGARGTIEHFAIPLVQEILQNHSGILDSRRIFVTGISDGGNGCLYAALRHPNLFSMAVCDGLGFKREELESYVAASKEAMSRLAKTQDAQQQLRYLVLSLGEKDPFHQPINETVHALPGFLDKIPFLNKLAVQVRFHKGIGHATQMGTTRWPALWD